MTYEEALFVMEGVMDDYRPTGGCEIAFRKALASLEKQIPRKHKMVDNVLYCSACESYHGRYGDIRIPVGSDFCPYCGQAIDWSDVDE